MVVQNQTGIPFIGTHAGTLSHWLIGTEIDSVKATHMLPSPPHPTTSFTCSLSPFHKTTRAPFHHFSSPSFPAFAPAAVNSRIPVCVSVHPSLSSLLSPLHPSIPFFHVCSAVNPSWIRPASLVTCSLRWCGNKQLKTSDAKMAKPVPFCRACWEILLFVVFK